MSTLAWILAASLVVTSFALALVRGRRGVREGRGAHALARLKSPTVYLFMAYLLVAGFVSPTSEGESASPLLGLAVAIPIAYATASFSAIGSEHPKPWHALLLGIVHGMAVLAAAAMVLAVVSPAFVPALLK